MPTPGPECLLCRRRSILLDQIPVFQLLDIRAMRAPSPRFTSTRKPNISAIRPLQASSSCRHIDKDSAVQDGQEARGQSTIQIR
jgi:hypothetical protein